MEFAEFLHQILTNTDVGFGMLALASLLVMAYSISSQRADRKTSNDVAIRHIDLISETTKAITMLDGTMRVVESGATARDSKIVEAISVLSRSLVTTNDELKKFEKPVQVISDLAHANHTLLGELKDLNEKTISRYDLVASALEKIQGDILLLLTILKKEEPIKE